MTKVTDRLDNQHIINLAKQQYEQQQYKKSAGIIVPLPSEGLVYPKTSVLREGTVEIRYMTAYDEDILTNSSYISKDIVLEKLIESILITPVDVNDLIPTDLQSIILAAKISSYGNMHDVIVSDTTVTPNKPLETQIDLTAITGKKFKLTPDDSGEFEYVVDGSGDVIKFKFLTNHDIKLLETDKMLSGIIETCIQSVNGNQSRNDIHEYVKYKLIGGAARKFRTYIIDNIPALDLNIEYTGESGDTFTAGFRISSNIFWV
jgi:hypothetical protein